MDATVHKGTTGIEDQTVVGISCSPHNTVAFEVILCHPLRKRENYRKTWEKGGMGGVTCDPKIVGNEDNESVQRNVVNEKHLKANQKKNVLIASLHKASGNSLIVPRTKVTIVRL
jgi:hypothetical protein